jgi:hypothetical protein
MDTKIFRYNDGSADVYADPVAVYRRFMEATEGDPDPLLKAAQRPDPGPDGTPPREEPGALLHRLDAERQLVEAARVALPMKPFDPTTGGGATDEQCLAALYAWLSHLEGGGRGAAS